MSRANEPVHPVTDASAYEAQGLTIREHFAAMAMQGLLASGNARVADEKDVPKLMEYLGKFSAQAADALIAELAKERTP